MFSIFEKIFDNLSMVFSFLNRDHSPSNKAVIKHSSVGSVQQAGRDIHNTSFVNSTRPRIDITDFGGSGGADGTFLTFRLRNDGGEAAVDIQCKLIADNIGGRSLSHTIANLAIGQLSQNISFPYHTTEFFNQQLSNPRITFCYRAADGREFTAGRTVVQENRADGRYNIHITLGAYFE